ncbi:MAG: hypothetical protein OXI22_04775 [Defluviicoccus sp.]|nr:hypothetical protein [Defluviicoccus sp.]MDE0383177.1 hypothetical protein [Defluviicoccus sp.]
MSPELIAIVAVGVALAGVLMPGQWALRRDIRALDERVGALDVRLARLEGAVDVLTRNVESLTRYMLDRERAAAGE